MNTPLSILARAVGLLALLTVLTGVAYPLAVTGAARALFPAAASGSLVTSRTGATVGSSLVGQSFEDPKHFWGRLSATTPHPYNAQASGGSNLGPTNALLAKNAQARIEALRAADPELTGPIPVDLVTASGSGLDPHISPAAAEVQVRRVARARGMTESAVRGVVAAHTRGRDLGILGEPRVDVLALNLALDGK